MAYLSVVEAAIELGFSVELVQKLMKRCPKRGENRKLAFSEMDGGPVISDQEVEAYRRYLREPWPTVEGKRPHTPSYIKDDVKAESHHGCAICGSMDGGEVAHIDPVRDTLDNSPDNLLFLCPNHHTKYDYGFRPSSNITKAVILAAKEVKRASRRRQLRYEANAAGAIRRLLRMLQRMEESAREADDPTLLAVYTTEIKALLHAVPELCSAADEAAKRDTEFQGVDAVVLKRAPRLSKAALSGGGGKTDHEVRSAAQRVIDVAADVILEIDEVDCPHCGGRGQTGLVGDLCAFCGGSCFVSSRRAEEYDPEDIDEVPCPRCNGRGMTGLVSDLCAYCRGSCRVSQEIADSYDPEEIDEVDCPHCNGRGLMGLADDFCNYCGGSCLVSREQAESYDVDDIDEVDCPRCRGRGLTGLVSDYCAYCRGSCRISQERADAYNPEEIDEVDCPHCRGRGQIGRSGDYCGYCGGSCLVSSSKAESYDPDEIDEVECPRCGGSGQTGWVGDVCALCKGKTVVTEDVARAYEEKYG